VEARDFEGLTVVHLSGGRVALDEANALRLRERLFTLVEARHHHLALDLANVSFLTSTMVEGLLSLNRRLRALGGHLSLHRPTRPVAEVFAVLGLADVLDVSSSLPESPPED
jgi:anti-anti-sigma factor